MHQKQLLVLVHHKISVIVCCCTTLLQYVTTTMAHFHIGLLWFSVLNSFYSISTSFMWNLCSGVFVCDVLGGLMVLDWIGSSVSKSCRLKILWVECSRRVRVDGKSVCNIALNILVQCYKNEVVMFTYSKWYSSL